MESRFVVSIIAKDDIGITSAIASILADEKVNWLDSKMVRLGGQFAGVILAESDEKDLSSIKNKLDRLSSKGFKIAVSQDVLDLKEYEKKIGIIEVLGLDKTGIISAITSVLPEYSANIEELDTSIEIAPVSGNTLFKAKIKISVPADIDTLALRTRFEELQGKLMIDISFNI